MIALLPKLVTGVSAVAFGGVGKFVQEPFLSAFKTTFFYGTDDLLGCILFQVTQDWALLLR